MKKLLSGVLIVGLMMVNPMMAQACSKEKSECDKSASKKSECKIGKLKKKVKTLWKNKEALNLTEKQLTQIKDIKHKAMKELIQFKADKDIIMVDLKSAMWAESMDADGVNKLIDVKYAAKAKAAKTYIKAVVDIQEVLSSEQRGQWKGLLMKYKSGKSDCSKGSAEDKKICDIKGNKGSSKGSGK